MATLAATSRTARPDNTATKENLLTATSSASAIRGWITADAGVGAISEMVPSKSRIIPGRFASATAWIAVGLQRMFEIVNSGVLRLP